MHSSPSQVPLGSHFLGYHNHSTQPTAHLQPLAPGSFKHVPMQLYTHSEVLLLDAFTHSPNILSRCFPLPEGLVRN
jgi:hypothetical protein